MWGAIRMRKDSDMAIMWLCQCSLLYRLLISRHLLSLFYLTV
eukprot:COSAG06_NODE_249_length_19140_cov_18.998004_12_plen_42_part_00